MRPNQMFAHWEQVRADLLVTISKFEPNELTFRPYPNSWPVGKLMLHIAETEDYWLHHLVRGEVENPDYFLEDYPDHDTIREVLAQAHARTLLYLDTLEEADLWREYSTPSGEMLSLYWILWHVLEHEIHHRGELSHSLGILGRLGLDV